MAAASLQTVVKHLRSLAANGLTNRELLQRFVMDADDDAFAALVRRHGRLVLSVCRRVLGPDSEVDDVFQATFVVLARKASSIRKQPSVASWLYGVAYHLATKVRGKRSRRRRREITSQVVLDQLAENETMHTDPVGRASLSELGTIMDEELQRLPPTCRDAVVTCLMLGLSHTEATKQLGWPLGTLKTRLQRGRELLRERLERRGVGLSAVAVTVVLAEQARAIVPATLMRATIEGAAHQAVSATALALANGAMRTLGATTIKLAVFSTLAVGAIGFGASALPVPGTKAEPPGVATASAKLWTPIQTKAQAKPMDAYGDTLPAGAIARLGTVRWRHDGVVNFAAFLDDGKKVASAANDRFIRIWDRATGTELRRFGPGPRPHGPGYAEAGGVGSDAVMDRDPTRVAVSEDGKLLATGYEPQEVDVWNIATGEKVISIQSEKRWDSWAIAFAPDGKHLAVASLLGPVRLWDIESGKILREFGTEAPNAVRARTNKILYSPDGDTLVSVVREADNGVLHRLRFWNSRTGRERYSVEVPDRNGNLSPVFSPDGRLFACTTRDSEILIIKVATGNLLHKIKMADEQTWTLLAFGPDSAKLYSKSSSMSGIALNEWDAITGKLLRRLDKRDPSAGGWVHYDMHEGSLVISPDGKTMLTAAGSNSINFLDLDFAKDATTSAGHTYGISSLSYTQDSKAVVTCGHDGTIQRWDTQTGKVVERLAQPEKAVKVATTDGRFLATDDYKTTITLIDNVAHKEIVTISLDDKLGYRHFFFSPTAKTLLVHQSMNSEAVLYDAASGKVQCRVALPYTGAEVAPSMATLFFSPDEQRLAVYSYAVPRTLMLYDTQTGKALQKLLQDPEVGIVGAAFSPDGRMIALDHGDGVLQLIEVASGKARLIFGTKRVPQHMPGPATGSGWVAKPRWSGESGSSTVAFSPDGRLLAHGDQKTLNIWDVVTGKILAPLNGHTGRIKAVAFAPDGHSITTAGEDTTALIWDVRRIRQDAKH